MKDPRGRKKAVRPDQHGHIVAQYATGRTAKDIGKEMGCHGNTILSVLRENGVDCLIRSGGKGNKKVTPASAARAKQLRDAGVPWKLVEREIGLSTSALWAAMVRMEKGEPV